MDIPANQLKNLKLGVDERELEELLDRIMSRRAVLFVGAGFSAGATNSQNTEPPQAKDLSRRISRLGKFTEDEDLMFTSDFFLAQNDAILLIDFLKEQYSIKSTKDYHDIICRAAWKRIYTTNYDDTIERSALNNGMVMESITVEDDPTEYFKKHNVCVHINGSIASLSDVTIRSSFKLSTSSYVSPDSFVASPWYYPFKKDLERSSAIVFVGYSLYDIDIQKILFESPEFKNKTYFITRPEPSEKELFTLSKYGKVFAIGSEDFSRRLKNRLSVAEPLDKESELWTDAFAEYTLTDDAVDITDNEITAFILHGNISDGHVVNALAGQQRKPFLINRTSLLKAVNLLKTDPIVVICSELGNGKTVFCREMMAHLSLLGRRTFCLDDGEGDYIGDLERLQSEQCEATLIVEGYERYPELLKYFVSLNPKKIRMVLSARTSSHERMRSMLSDLNINAHEISLDFMDENEIPQLIGIIDNIGYWGKEAHYSVEKKSRVIRDVGQNQISHTLLNMFHAPQITNRIGELVERVCGNENYKKTLFSICLLESLDLPLMPSLISEVAGSNEVYKMSMRENSEFLQLYQISNGVVRSKSSLFSLHLLNYHFSPSFAVDMLLAIVQKYDKLQRCGIHEKEIFKALLRFSSLEKILPERRKRDSLTKYYEELKTLIPWMKKNPHYWLQYGMARITFKDYSKADAYFKQAYALADNIEGYDTSYIDNQKARLELLIAAEESDHIIAFKHFLEAHRILASQDNDVYKFRQVALYKDFFDLHYRKLPAKSRAQFESACKAMTKALTATYDPVRSVRHEHTTFRSCGERLEVIISTISGLTAAASG